MTLCHITGSVKKLTGESAGNVSLWFNRENIYADSSNVVIPEEITTVTDSNGNIDISLYSGKYTVTSYINIKGIPLPKKIVSTIHVPEEESTSFASLFGNSVEITNPMIAAVQELYNNMVPVVVSTEEAFNANTTSIIVILSTDETTFTKLKMNGLVLAGISDNSSENTVPDQITEWTWTTGLEASQIVASITAPSDGGSPITGYEYSLDGGTTAILLTGTGPWTLTMDAAGTAYTAVVRAINAIGAGAWSTSKTATSGAFAA